MKEVTAQVKLTKGEDGIWVHFSSISGKHASFHVVNTWRGCGIVDAAMREWAEEQFPKPKKRIMPPERAIPVLIANGWLFDGDGNMRKPNGEVGILAQYFCKMGTEIAEENLWPKLIIEDMPE